MNWLAHILLSRKEIDYQLGNLLADLLKGKSWQGASCAFNQGLSMHREIDRFTDLHSQFIQSKSRLGREGRLKGVVIDIAYDHLLAKNWHLYAKIPFDDFITRFHQRSQAASSTYPVEARNFVSKLTASEHLRRYQSFSGLEQAFRQVDQRLSARVLRRETTCEYLPRLRELIGPVEVDFKHFMPDVIEHFKSISGARQESHWLI